MVSPGDVHARSLLANQGWKNRAGTIVITAASLIPTRPYLFLPTHTVFFLLQKLA
jgi:hypothetical protein